MSPIQTESRKAMRELIDLLSEVDERWASAVISRAVSRGSRRAGPERTARARR